MLFESVEHLILQPSKECFHNAVVVAVALSGHGLDDSVLLQFIPIKIMLVLPALIRVHDQSLHGRKPIKSLRQHIFNLLHVGMKRKIVGNNLIGVRIQERRNVAFAPRKVKLRYVGCPFLQGLLGAEIPIDDIISDFAHIAFVGMVLFFRSFAFQRQLLHNALDALVIHMKATVEKFMVYSPYSVSFFVFLKNSRDFRRQCAVSFFDCIRFIDFIIIR